MMDEPQTGIAIDKADSLAPSLPRVSSAAEFTEVATQCELMPAADRDASETKDTKRLRAVAFRIAGGRGNMSAAEARAAATSGSGEGHAAGSGSALTRRASSASTVDDAEAGRGTAGLSEESEEMRAAGRACQPSSGPSDHLDSVIRHKHMQESIVQQENVVYVCLTAPAWRCVAALSPPACLFQLPEDECARVLLGRAGQESRGRPSEERWPAALRLVCPPRVLPLHPSLLRRGAAE